MALTKAEVAAKIADKVGISQAKANEALTAFGEVFIEAVKKDGEFGLTGLFTAKVKKTAARDGRNPATGAAIKIPAGKTVRISAGSVVKKAVK